MRGGSHLSGGRFASPLERPTRRRTPFGQYPKTGWGGLSLDDVLLGLAPRGVCIAASVTEDAVSSYLAISPLPTTTLTPSQAVSFLLHFPSPLGTA